MANIISGTLTKEKIDSLSTALQDAVKVGVSKCVLDFNKENQTLQIFGACQETGGMARLYFDSCMFDGFEFVADLKFGIYSLAEFVGVLDLFSVDTVIKITAESFELISPIQNFKYYASDLIKIPTCSSNLPPLDIQASLTWQQSVQTQSYIKALGKMINANHTSIKLEKGVKEVDFLITGKDHKVNTYTTKLPLTSDAPKQNLKIFIHKENITGIFATKIKTFNIDIYERFVILIGKTVFYKIEYVVALVK